MNWHERYKRMLEYYDWTDKHVAELTGNSEKSIKTVVGSKSQEFPRWAKLAVEIFERERRDEKRSFQFSNEVSDILNAKPNAAEYVEKLVRRDNPPKPFRCPDNQHEFVEKGNDSYAVLVRCKICGHEEWRPDLF